MMQASNIFSVGGSLSTNVHGWDHQAGSLIHTIKSITIIDTNGNEKKLRKNSLLTEEKELFNLVIGGHGLFGIIIEAEIELTEDAVLNRKAEIVPLQNYAAHFETACLPNPNVALHYGRLSLDPNHLFEEVISVNYFKDDNHNYQKPKHLDEELQGGSTIDRIKIHILRRLKIAKHLKQWHEKISYLPSKWTSRNEVMRPTIRFIEHPSKADFVKFVAFTSHLKRKEAQGAKAPRMEKTMSTSAVLFVH